MMRGQVAGAVPEPKRGAYCSITLESGETIVVNHDRDPLDGGRLTVERPSTRGIGPDRIFECDFAYQPGKSALVFLFRAAPERGLGATPLEAFVRYLRSCGSVREIQARCRSLLAVR
jgi:hypothetical protein